MSHAVPGAELTLYTSLGDEISVGVHEEASIDPCAMRSVVIASACPSRPNLAERILAVELAGAVEDRGCGIYRFVDAGREQRWIATVLRPDRASRILGAVPADSVHGRVRPDLQLGVSLLVITATVDGDDETIDQIAVDAAAACFAEELIVSTETASAQIGDAT